MKNNSETVKKIKAFLNKWGAIEVIVTDNSHLHVGHEGAKSGGGHFAVVVKSVEFKGISRIKSHRMVYQLLNELFEDGSIHALEVNAIAA